MATFARLLSFTLFLQIGLSASAHSGHGHLHEVQHLRRDLHKRAAQINYASLPGNWTLVCSCKPTNKADLLKGIFPV